MKQHHRFDTAMSNFCWDFVMVCHFECCSHFCLIESASEDIRIRLAARYSDADGTAKVLSGDSCSPWAKASPNGLGESSGVCADTRPASSCGAGGSASGCAAHAASSTALDLCRALEAAKICSEHSRCQCSAQGGGFEGWNPASEERQRADRGTCAYLNVVLELCRAF